MKKLFLIILLLFPLSALAAPFAVGWNATSTTAGAISPNKVNGTEQKIIGNNGATIYGLVQTFNLTATGTAVVATLNVTGATTLGNGCSNFDASGNFLQLNTCDYYVNDEHYAFRSYSFPNAGLLFSAIAAAICSPDIFGSQLSCLSVVNGFSNYTINDTLFGGSGTPAEKVHILGNLRMDGTGEINGAGTLRITNPVQATVGGTGLASYKQGDLLTASSTNITTLTQLAIGGAGKILVSDGSMPTWGNGFTVASATTTSATTTSFYISNSLITTGASSTITNLNLTSLSFPNAATTTLFNRQPYALTFATSTTISPIARLDSLIGSNGRFWIGGALGFREDPANSVSTLRNAGLATLTTGTVTVNTSYVIDANTRFITSTNISGTVANLGTPYISATTTNSFTITSTNLLSNAVIYWEVRQNTPN